MTDQFVCGTSLSSTTLMVLMILTCSCRAMLYQHQERVERGGGPSAMLLVPYPRVGKRNVQQEQSGHRDDPLLNALEPAAPQVVPAAELLADLDHTKDPLDSNTFDQYARYASYLGLGKRSDENIFHQQPKRLLMARVGKRFLHTARVGK